MLVNYSLVVLLNKNRLKYMVKTLEFLQQNF